MIIDVAKLWADYAPMLANVALALGGILAVYFQGGSLLTWVKTKLPSLPSFPNKDEAEDPTDEYADHKAAVALLLKAQQLIRDKKLLADKAQCEKYCRYLKKLAAGVYYPEFVKFNDGEQQ